MVILLPETAMIAVYWTLSALVYTPHAQVERSCTSLAAMAARATRSASRKARLTEAVATGPLGALSHDELGVIVDGLADPLQPVVAVALSSTCLGLRTPLRAALKVLKQRYAKAKLICRKVYAFSDVDDLMKPVSIASLRDAKQVEWKDSRLTVADMAIFVGVSLVQVPLYDRQRE